MGFESLIGNAIAFLLKNKTKYATKAIPIALFVWNVLYVMLRAFDSSLLDGGDVSGAAVRQVSIQGYVLGYDSLYQNVGVFGSLGGLFMTALQETGKQMFFHSSYKNVLMQWLVPTAARMAKKR